MKNKQQNHNTNNQDQMAIIFFYEMSFIASILCIYT